MKINQRLLTVTIVAGALACGGGNEAADGNQEPKAEAQSMYQKAPDPMENPGIGPVKELTLPAEIDQEMAKRGEEVYVLKCTACHNPEGMVAEDPIAKKLLMEYNGSPMANQGLTEDEARAILEYFRTI